ncbi:hypothetical protein ElyMa_003709400 [Elysia marginata]|uniref:Uncharacterized protein n=1 Tax=Elysia marginata TaxID=1093978 RepID=A0AAV4F3I2_9GAST|nr:hypothetical protein ElyMa_003709400 [Elysia marginata]
MGYLNKSFQQQRTALADMTSENQSRAQNHSAEEIQVEDQDEELRQLINVTSLPRVPLTQPWKHVQYRNMRHLYPEYCRPVNIVTDTQPYKHVQYRNT